MATRAIVTSLPDVACDICGRRLLRGEQPEVFIAGVEHRTVCELCAPRAAHEGWTRASDAAAAADDSLSMRPSRRRGRGASLLGRLRQLREQAVHPAAAAGAGTGQLHDNNADDDDPDLSDDELDELMSESGWGYETVRFDSPQRHVAPQPAPQVQPVGDRGSASAAGAYEPRQASELERALELFNAGEHPRRVSGVARSLGDPSVTVRAAEGSSSGARYTIVVAWELCWYRYEVSLDEPDAGAQLLDKGMELDELPGEDRLANAAADEHGELRLVA